MLLLTGKCTVQHAERVGIVKESGESKRGMCMALQLFNRPDTDALHIAAGEQCSSSYNATWNAVIMLVQAHSMNPSLPC